MSLTVEQIRQAVIGERHPIETPFGLKPLIYADYTASGRSLTFVEDFIRDNVLPFYANTHTETSFTGRQTTALREQARDQIRSAVKATAEHKVIFCGSGATAAIDKLIAMLGVRIPAGLDDRYHWQHTIPESERPVVFVGPFEHHSNELPWRETIATVVSIPLNKQDTFDLEALERELIRYKDRPLKIGSFSAASNVTGIKSPVAQMSALLRRFKVWSCWDYAAAAPYVSIDMTENHLDAVYISPHKFVGGPGTPGLLVVNKKMLNNRVPAVPGGGTVSFVTPSSHTYLENIERREEGGTPGIVESIRAGLVFKVQQSIGCDVLESLEQDMTRAALTRLIANPNIDVLGNTQADRLSIISLRVTHKGKALHYSFIVALLNDLLGVQMRGGCSCAGPYGHHLLGMDAEESQAIEAQIDDGNMLLRPGWVRLNLNYFIGAETFNYLLSALELVAEHGWRMLPYYQYCDDLGVWLFQGSRPDLPASIDTFLGLRDSTQEAEDNNEGVSNERFNQEIEISDLPKYLQQAEDTLLGDKSQWQRFGLPCNDALDGIRWYVLPQDIID